MRYFFLYLSSHRNLDFLNSHHKFQLYWQAGRWSEAADTVKYLIEEPQKGHPLSVEQVNYILDWATTLKKAGKETVLVRLRNKFLPYFANTEYHSIFNILTNQLEKDKIDINQIDSIVNDVETFTDNAKFYEEPAAAPVNVPMGKFAMYAGWQPDSDFIRLAAMWGIALAQPATPEELAAFVAYWQAEGKVFHHVQWQQKLARSLQMGRSSPNSAIKRDINALCEPDNEIPPGFRG